jgi:hypothetical protein
MKTSGLTQHLDWRLIAASVLILPGFSFVLANLLKFEIVYLWIARHCSPSKGTPP